MCVCASVCVLACSCVCKRKQKENKGKEMCIHLKKLLALDFRIRPIVNDAYELI